MSGKKLCVTAGDKKLWAPKEKMEKETTLKWFRNR
jgi:hypothetical protein